jgi:hypothetical protein
MSTCTNFIPRGAVVRASITVALLLGGAAVAGAQWQNALKPQGAPAGEFKLVEAGKPVCTIVISDQTAAVENSAAKELQHWIQEITGVAPENATADNVASHPIRIITEEALGEEGYRIAIEGDALILTGGEGRGVMNAVFALLEEDLGCRFYTNESIKLPTADGKKLDSLAVTPVTRHYTPQLRLRDPYYKVAFDPAWSLRNRTNAPNAVVPEALGGHVDYGGMFVHTAASLVPSATHFATHPEYFFLTAAGQRAPNQLCSTEPEVLKIATAAVLETLKTNPHTEIISVSKNDNFGDQICHCERCKKLREAEGGDMACQLVLVNGIAEAVEKQYPNVVIDTLAYLETIQVPKTMRPRENVVIRFCSDSVGAWSKPFTPAAECPADAIAAAWSATHDRIYVWDYNVNFSHYLAPMPNIDVMAANIRFWAQNNAEGVMLQGGYQGPAERDELKSWVTAKLLWDPSRDEKALVADFIWGHYGVAAPLLMEYEALLESWKAEHAAAFAAPPHGIRYSMDAPFFTKDFVDRATEVFARAKAAASGDEVLLRRVERAELPILYVKGSRGKTFVGEGYADAVAEFERIGRREGVSFLAEGAANFEPTVAGWKAAAAAP